MDMNEKTKKFEVLMKNEELAKEFFNNDSAEDAQRWLAEHGVDCSIDEVRTIAKIAKKIQSGEITQEMIENGELSDDELAMASGGFGLGLMLLGIVGVAGGLGALGAGGFWMSKKIESWLR